MEVRISFPLSNTTRPDYERALQDVKESEEKRKGKVIGVESQKIDGGGFAGVIVMEEPA